MTAVAGPTAAGTAYAAAVAATLAAGLFRSGLPEKVCAALLCASWMVWRVVHGSGDLLTLAPVYGGLHLLLLIAALAFLAQAPARWLLVLLVLAGADMALHIGALLQGGAARRPDGYGLGVAVIFTAQLACVWLARTGWGRGWPGGLRQQAAEG